MLFMNLRQPNSNCLTTLKSQVQFTSDTNKTFDRWVPKLSDGINFLTISIKILLNFIGNDVFDEPYPNKTEQEAVQS